MQYKEPVVGIEPTTGALRMRYSTSELHRLIDYYKRVYYTLVAHLTLAIIPFAYSPCQAFIHLSMASHQVAVKLLTMGLWRPQ